MSVSDKKKKSKTNTRETISARCWPYDSEASYNSTYVYGPIDYGECIRKFR